MAPRRAPLPPASYMLTAATHDDCAWLSATGRQFRPRAATAREVASYPPEAMGDACEHLCAVVRRLDGFGLLVPTATHDAFHGEPDGALARFSPLLDMLTQGQTFGLEPEAT